MIRFKDDTKSIPVYISQVEKRQIDALKPGDLLTQKGRWFVNLLEKHLSSNICDELRDKKVLIKPNLLKARDPLCVTSPLAIVGSAISLIEKGAKVSVGDSPAFGSATQVLKSLGITKILQDLGVKIVCLNDPYPVTLPCGAKISVSKHAISSQLIVNLPRLKAHCQTGITGAVKNLYGTVPGFRKAFYHVRYGRDERLFARMILEIGQLLPATLSLMDAVVVMHETGPTGGRPLYLGAVASSVSAHALDTSMYMAIGAEPASIPIWMEARAMKIPGAFTKNLSFPWIEPKDIIKARDFKIPRELKPIAFRPERFILGRLKSLGRRIGIIK